jgi:sugar/nucleoside kinase (ribokinase family)
VRLAAARARGATTILDVVAPAGGEASLEAASRLLPHVDYFVPNRDEAFALTGEADPARAADKLAERGARTTIIKLGERGIYVRSAAGSFALDAPPVAVVEPSGAGDGFAAGLAVGVLEGWGLEETAWFASVIGASACTALGCAAGIFSRAEADAFVSEHPLRQRGGGGA